jgi:CrcB protein
VTFLGVLVAGALGAPARYLVERAARRVGSAIPWGTFVVNVSGSFALGVVTGVALTHGISPATRAVISTGFLGAYTTFSTYVYEVVRQAEQRRASNATIYLLASVVIGTGAAAAGLALTGGL